MVKILEKTKDERKREKKHQTLVDIARDKFANKGLAISDLHNLSIGIFEREGENLNYRIFVFTGNNEVHVYDPKYFRKAKQLAEEYEFRIKEDFILKKEY